MSAGWIYIISLYSLLGLGYTSSNIADGINVGRERGFIAGAGHALEKTLGLVIGFGVLVAIEFMGVMVDRVLPWLPNWADPFGISPW